MKLDTVIAEVNADLQDCLAPVRDRFRLAVATVINYAIANPAQGSAATAQLAIAATFRATYSDGLVTPGVTIDQFVTAFSTRHGVGGTANARWVSIRDFIVARAAFVAKLLRWLEEGALEDVGALSYRKVSGNDPDGFYTAPADLVYSETRDQNPGPTFNFLTERRWSSASLGLTVRKVLSNVYDGTRVSVSEGAPEVV